jgi:hypothetical protein
MTPTAPNKEITAQAMGAALVAVAFGVLAWLAPEVSAPPAGLEAGAAVIVGYIVAIVRKGLARRKMTETQLEADKALCAGRVSAE